MLETIRAYARDQLTTSGELHQTQQRHAHHYLELLEHTDQHYAKDWTRFEDLIRGEDANLTQAITWAWANEPDTAMHHLGALLWGWYHLLHRYTDIQTWTERALSSPRGTPLDRAKVTVLRLRVPTDTLCTDLAEQERLSDDVRPHLETFTDEWHRRWIYAQSGLASDRGDLPAALAWTDQFRTNSELPSAATQLRACFLAGAGRCQEAYDLSAPALAKPASEGHPRDRMWDLLNLGFWAVILGKYDAAREHLDQAQHLTARPGILMTQLAALEVNLGWLALVTDRPAEALTRVRAVLEHPESAIDTYDLIETLLVAGHALVQLDRLDDARAIAVVALQQPKPGDVFVQSELDRLVESTGIDKTSHHPQQVSAEDLPRIVRDAVSALADSRSGLR